MMKKNLMGLFMIFLTILTYSQNLSEYETDFAQKFPKIAGKFKLIYQNNEYDNSIITCNSELEDIYLTGYCNKENKNWYFSIGLKSKKSISESGEFLNLPVIQKIVADADKKMEEFKEVYFDYMLCNITVDESQTNYMIAYTSKTAHINYILYYDAKGIFTDDDINDQSGPDD